MKCIKYTLRLVLLIFISSSAYAEFKSFDEEVSLLKKHVMAVECKVTAASPEIGMGRLYGCLHPVDRNVKLWVNEDPEKPNRVANMKVQWIEYDDVMLQFNGANNAANKATTLKWIKFLDDNYELGDFTTIKKSFLSSKASTILPSSKFNLKTTYSAGPSADERYLVIEAK